jgi:hypothetical protein
MTRARLETTRAGGIFAARALAGWLCLAATPTFALMALATMLLDAGPMATMCAGDMGGWSLGGMAPMYLLMAAFHLGPWLEMASSRRGEPRRR